MAGKKQKGAKGKAPSAPGSSKFPFVLTAPPSFQDHQAHRAVTAGASAIPCPAAAETAEDMHVEEGAADGAPMTASATTSGGVLNNTGTLVVRRDDLSALLAWFIQGLPDRVQDADDEHIVRPGGITAKMAFSPLLGKEDRVYVHRMVGDQFHKRLETSSEGVGEARQIVVYPKGHAPRTRRALTAEEQEQVEILYRLTRDSNSNLNALSKDEIAEIVAAEKGLEGTALEGIWNSCNREEVEQETKMTAAIMTGDLGALQAALGELPRLKERGVPQVSGIHSPHVHTPHHHHHDHHHASSSPEGDANASPSFVAAADSVGANSAAKEAVDAPGVPKGRGGGVFLREPPLCLAARLRNVEAVRSLLAAGFNPEARDPATGRTALQISRTFETCDCEALLLQAGAHDPDVKHFPLSSAVAFLGDPHPSSRLAAATAAVADPSGLLKPINTTAVPAGTLRSPLNKVVAGEGLLKGGGLVDLAGMIMGDDDEDDMDEEGGEEMEEWASESLAAAMAAINRTAPVISDPNAGSTHLLDSIPSPEAASRLLAAAAVSPEMSAPHEKSKSNSATPGTSASLFGNTSAPPYASPYCPPIVPMSPSHLGSPASGKIMGLPLSAGLVTASLAVAVAASAALYLLQRRQGAN